DSVEDGAHRTSRRPGEYNGCLNDRSGADAEDRSMHREGPSCAGSRPSREKVLTAGIDPKQSPALLIVTNVFNVPFVAANQLAGAELSRIIVGDEHALSRPLSLSSVANANLTTDVRTRPSLSSASRLIGTPRKRTISARGVCHGQSSERRWSAAGRRGATTRVWRSGARPWWQDVSTAQERGGAAAVARRRPGDSFARAGCDGSDV